MWDEDDLLLLTGIVAILGGSSLGRIFYVDTTGGSNSNSGLSPAAAWQTIAKVNAAALLPGDSVLFKRGETFPGSIVPPAAGAAGALITFADYGSGALPVIDGNGTSGAFYCAAATKHHYQVTNLDLYRGGYGGAANSGAHDITFTGCIGRSTTNCGFSAWHALAGDPPYNVSCINCVANNNAVQGIFMGADVATNTGPINCLIDHCTCYSNGTDIDAHHGIYARYQVEVRYCECYSNSGAGIKFNDQANVNHALTPIAHHNYVHGNRYGFVLNHNDALVYDNLSISNQANVYVAVGNPGRYTRFLHNTCVNATATLRGWHFENNLSSDWVIKNNIFVQSSGFPAQTIRSASGSAATLAANNVWDNNCHYVDGVAGTTIIFDGTNLTLAQWKAAGAGANEKHVTPLFVTAYTDFHLQAGSTLKAAGATGQGILTDYADVVRGATPSIGAYE